MGFFDFESSGNKNTNQINRLGDFPTPQRLVLMEAFKDLNSCRVTTMEIVFGDVKTILS